MAEMNGEIPVNPDASRPTRIERDLTPLQGLLLEGEDIKWRPVPDSREARIDEIVQLWRTHLMWKRDEKGKPEDPEFDKGWLEYIREEAEEFSDDKQLEERVLSTRANTEKYMFKEFEPTPSPINRSEDSIASP